MRDDDHVSESAKPIRPKWKPVLANEAEDEPAAAADDLGSRRRRRPRWSVVDVKRKLE